MTKDCHILSYCGLVDARISASEKDLPVLAQLNAKPTLNQLKEIHI